MWRLATRIMATSPQHVERAVGQIVHIEALYFVRMAKIGIRTQAPGGRRFKPISENTKRTRRFLGFRGTKALIVAGDLRNSIRSHRISSHSAFVGVLKGTRGKNGKDLTNIAAVHEFGAGPIVIRITPKMRAFMAAAGLMPSTGAGTGSQAPGVGVIVINIPARPFMGPTLDAHFRGPAFKNRVMWRISRGLRGQFGRPSGSRPST